MMETKDEKVNMDKRQAIFHQVLTNVNNYQKLHNGRELPKLSLMEQTKDLYYGEQEILAEISVDEKVYTLDKSIPYPIFVYSLYLLLAVFTISENSPNLSNLLNLSDLYKEKKKYDENYKYFVLFIFFPLVIAFSAMESLFGLMLFLSTLSYCIYLVDKRVKEKDKLDKRIDEETRYQSNLLATSWLTSAKVEDKKQQALLPICQYISYIYTDSVRCFGEERGLVEIEKELSAINKSLPQGYRLSVETGQKKLSVSESKEWLATQSTGSSNNKVSRLICREIIQERSIVEKTTNVRMTGVRLGKDTASASTDVNSDNTASAGIKVVEVVSKFMEPYNTTDDWVKADNLYTDEDRQIDFREESIVDKEFQLFIVANSVKTLVHVGTV